ncbi:gluconate 2-dehydrogenase subunit 3 family protein [Pedobacter sp.]|uniref:gluconate 2-dehydrogenase subunit 3 family protein n=1 Tax=Pedobacter sp. TaxID=1411316 RepID=UPI003BA95E38
MNRRTSVKGILALGFVGASSVSLYKWINLHRDFNISELLSQKSLIAELAETIIPTTHTPGAKQAGVQNYIINVIINCTGKVEQNRFLNGLHNVNNYSVEEFNKSFVDCSSTERISILKSFESKDSFKYPIINKINNKLLGQTFFSKLKQLTVDGYCSSEIGATLGLAYDYIPGTYQACTNLQRNQKSWATK